MHYSYERCKFLLLSQFVSCFKYQMWCELWQISLLQLCVSTHTTVSYLAVLQVQHTRWRAVAYCQVLHMYQPQESLSSPHLPWYWALNPFRRWLLSDVKCSRSQFLLLMTGDGRFMPVSLEWEKQQNLMSKIGNRNRILEKAICAVKLIHACCKSRLEKGSMWVCFPKRPLRLWQTGKQGYIFWTEARACILILAFCHFMTTWLRAFTKSNNYWKVCVHAHCKSLAYVECIIITAYYSIQY